YDGTSQIQVMAAIGGIVSGMSASGILRHYLDKQISTFQVSVELKEILSIFEETVTRYKSIKNSELKEEMSSEVVESAARLLGSLVFEKSVYRVKAEIHEKRKLHSKNFNTDSLAVLNGNLLKINAMIVQTQT
ncbi:MAG: acyl-CoA dehydrogenase, partial [Leptospira sp.]|nr:acyl-CoA dehydrogenase [Leptospira sp.]